MSKTIITFKTLFARGERGWVKILCLSMGFAISAVLITKVWFDQSYDSFWEDSERIHRINQVISMNGKPEKEYGQTSGGIAPTLMQISPSVERATRYTTVASECGIISDNRDPVKADLVAFADSSFFDIFTLRIIAGDPKATLSTKGQCMISESLAMKLGGDPLGKSISSPDLGGKMATVGGIYEDIPENSILAGLDILLSLETIGEYVYDGSNGFFGNDRYKSFIKVKKGIVEENLSQDIEKLIKEYLPTKELLSSGIGMNFSTTPISEVHSGESYVRKLSWILSLLTFIILLCAVMNYLMVTISRTVTRSKEMAVRKCYGAGRKEISWIVFSEAALYMIVSVLAAVMIMLALKERITELLGSNISTQVSIQSLFILGAISCIILLVNTVIPTLIYCRIPVSAAFRNYKESRRTWKRALLTVQMALAGFMITLVVLIGRQYSLIINNDLGYNKENLAYVELSSVSWEERKRVAEQLAGLPCVKEVTSAWNLLFSSQNGDNISLPDNETATHITNLYFTPDNFCEVMEIPIIEGSSFTSEYGDTTNRQVMIEKRTAELLRRAYGWEGSLVGREFQCTGVSPGLYNIVGIYDNIHTGSLAGEESDPTIMFNGGKYTYPYIYIRYHTLSPENLDITRKSISESIPNTEYDLRVYNNEIVDQYSESRRFRDSVFAGSIVALTIAILGLIGYVNDELIRRRKEIAIRRINGAEIRTVYYIYIKDLLCISVPSLTIGAAASYIVGNQWLQNFSEKVSLSIPLFILSIIAVLTLTLTVSLFRTAVVVRENPADNIKSE